MTSPSGFLPYGRQSVNEDDIAAVIEVLRSDWLTTGPTVDSFETAFAETVNVPFAVACSSGTAALHLAVLALGLEPGDHVVVPTLTFLATANAVRLAGAEVIFTDVDPDTGLMRPDDLEQALDAHADKRIKAVFPVHLAGQAVAMERLAAVAGEHGLKLVTDACHALGTTYRTAGGDVPVGTCRHGDMAAFSFHPVKTIACGEGGMVTTRDAGLAARLRRLRNHGIIHDETEFTQAELGYAASGEPNPWYYEMQEVGLNYRISDIHCALGLSQLSRLDQLVRRRRQLAARYDLLLADLAPVVVPAGRAGDCNPAWHIYSVLVDFDALGVDRAALMERLRAAGVGTQVHYLPVHMQPYYRRLYGDADLPGAEAYYRRTLTLPLYPAMTDADVARVVDALLRQCEA